MLLSVSSRQIKVNQLSPNAGPGVSLSLQVLVFFPHPNIPDSTSQSITSPSWVEVDVLKLRKH